LVGLSPAQETIAALRQVGVLDEVVETAEGLDAEMCKSQVAMALAKRAMAIFFVGHASLN
jgi:hypothetical protein